MAKRPRLNLGIHLGKKINISKRVRLPYTQYLPTVVATTWIFTLFVAMMEAGKCDYSKYPDKLWEALTDGDVQTASLREISDVPFQLAIVEGLVGFCAIAIPSLATALGDIVPGVLVMILITVRVHSMGVFGCYDSDHVCCPQLNCPNELSTGYISGCGEGAMVYWRDKNNYCPLPPWFLDYKNTCGQLSQAQDVVPCYTYGCSYNNTPLRYVANRVWAILSFLSLLGIVKEMVVIDMLKFGSIKFLTSKKKI